MRIRENTMKRFESEPVSETKEKFRILQGESYSKECDKKDGDINKSM